MKRNRSLSVEDTETLLDMVFGDFAASYGDDGMSISVRWPRVNGRYYNKLKRLITEYKDDLELENMEIDE